MKLLLLLSLLSLAALLANATTMTPSINSIPNLVANLFPDASGTGAGIFTQNFNTDKNGAAAGQYSYDDFDLYVPYRSDELDHFSIELSKHVMHELPQQNVIISPFSVKLVLAILAEAAGNNTQTQKELIAHMTDLRSPDNLRGFYKKILNSLKTPNPYSTLNLETKLYADKFIEPQQRYAAILSTSYDTEIENLDFKNYALAAQTINRWCSNVTEGRLQQLVNEQNLRDKVMLLVNVIYFKGMWRRQFNDTYQSVFFRTPKQQIKVDYMEQTDYFYYHQSKELHASILRLPYKGKKFSMFIILPKLESSLDEFINTLDSQQIKRMQWLMEETKVKLIMPKFKFDMKKSFKQTLNSMGIHEVFTDAASLPGLARGAHVAGQLKVSDIYQKSGIEVNELGTEALAATVVEIVNKFGGPNELAEFNVNRPFIFFIEEEATGNILFVGKVMQPNI